MARADALDGRYFRDFSVAVQMQVRVMFNDWRERKREREEARERRSEVLSRDRLLQGMQASGERKWSAGGGTTEESRACRAGEGRGPASSPPQPVFPHGRDRVCSSCFLAASS